MDTTSEPWFWEPAAIPGSTDRFRLTPTPAACVGSTGRELMMGGVTTGAALLALERATGRELLWSTSQFVSAAFPDRDYEIQVDELVAGRSLTQARATVVDGDRIVLLVQAALGRREGDGVRQFASRPDVLAAAESPPKPVDDASANGVNLFAQFERRLAGENEQTGQEFLWFRHVGGAELSVGLLAIVADHLAGAHPRTRGSLSLDNTLRVLTLEPTDWILASTQLSGLGPRHFLGQMNLFSETGTLLAVASQTGVLPRRPA